VALRQSIASVDGLELEAAIHQATGQPAGTVVLAHGITADMDEGGMFGRLADALAAAGLTALRFSFRGHGRSGGTQQGVTVAGEMLDLQAVIAETGNADAGRLFVVAASFGAVATLLSLPYLEDRLSGLVLWNPVLDLSRTFVKPELPWGMANFSSDAQRQLHTDGYLTIDGQFRLGRVIFSEFSRYNPVSCFQASKVPALIVHGDRDSYVSFEIAQEAARARADCSFHAIAGSDHGFDGREHEDEAITVTVSWLTALVPAKQEACGHERSAQPCPSRPVSCTGRMLHARLSEGSPAGRRHAWRRVPAAARRSGGDRRAVHDLQPGHHLRGCRHRTGLRR
jgi:alpha-beta hydrolase superfamily lysophospholipase